LWGALAVFEGNERALALYRRHGFIVTVQGLVFRWTFTENHGKLILGAAGQ
jgi:hypothetical protein